MAEDIRKMTNPEGIAEFDRGYTVPDCVVLDSAYCSMGRMVALHTDTTRWGEPATYDLMINTDLIGRDFAAQLLAKLMTGQD